jgi:hypothetical protein
MSRVSGKPYYVYVLWSPCARRFYIGLLCEFHRHPFLNRRLVLKGGTAINLFYLDLARLSVDIDLNYVGQIERVLAPV